MMLTEVSVGAGRFVRSGTVGTPLSSFSFYTIVSTPHGRDDGREAQTGCTGMTERLRARYHCRTCEVGVITNEQTEAGS